jgi:uncharacterized protein (TIGR02996 family)
MSELETDPWLTAEEVERLRREEAAYRERLLAFKRRHIDGLKRRWHAHLARSEGAADPVAGADAADPGELLREVVRSHWGAPWADEALGFARRVNDAPGDMAPRLAYAGWLEQHSPRPACRAWDYPAAWVECRWLRTPGLRVRVDWYGHVVPWPDDLLPWEELLEEERRLYEEVERWSRQYLADRGERPWEEHQWDADDDEEDEPDPADWWKDT